MIYLNLFFCFIYIFILYFLHLYTFNYFYIYIYIFFFFIFCFIELDIFHGFIDDAFFVSNHTVSPFVHVPRSRISVFSKGYLGSSKDWYINLERDLSTNYGQGNEGMNSLLLMNAVIFRGI